MTLKYVAISPLPQKHMMKLPMASKYVKIPPMTPNILLGPTATNKICKVRAYQIICRALISIGKQKLLI